jgi:hypothetical protein
MRFSKLIQRRIRRQGKGVDLIGDVNAAIAANVGERGGTTRTSSSQRIVQRSGRTVVSETRGTTETEEENGGEEAGS